MQLNNIGIAQGPEGRSCRRMLLVPIVVVAAARAPAPILRVEVIELYQGLVRPFQRCGKGYELRWGQLYARTIAHLPTDRTYTGLG
jgi:hypothetical protein